MIDLIKNIYPEAIIEEGAIPTLTVEAARYREVALRLKNDEGLAFDFMICMTGVDWGDSLGVTSLLQSTKHEHKIFLKTFTTDRENPELPTVADIWETANLNEREVYDFLGIRFINHPDMRRLFLRNDWVGYPLRKDYDANPEINPVRLYSEETFDTMPTFEADSHGGEVSEKENILFEEDEYVVNIGPQHPATHGVLRFRVSLEGEIVKKVDVNCGYIHRGIEKLCESLTYPQTLALTDRLDYLAAH